MTYTRTGLHRCDAYNIIQHIEKMHRNSLWGHLLNVYRHACCLLPAAGDQLPQPYPIVDVHIPERALSVLFAASSRFAARTRPLALAMMGPSDKKFVAAAQSENRGVLEDIEKRTSAYQRLLATSTRTLASKVEVMSS